MKVLFSCLVGLAVVAVTMVAPVDDQPTPVAAPQHLRQLEQRIAQQPTSENLTHLATAYLREAQRGGDVRYHAQAEEICDRVLEREGPTPNVLALKALSLAGQHRFREAIASARQAIALNPDWPAAYGALADGLIELGRYEQAVDAVQRMLDLKPTGAAYARAAHLRTLHGDQAGGLALMKLAVDASAPKGDRPWMLIHLANDQLAAGETRAALLSYEEILLQQPEQPLALAGVAKIAAARGDYETAVQYLERVLAQRPDPDAHVALGDALTVVGRAADAQTHYQEAERLERAELSGPGEPEYRHLAILLADRGTGLDEAVEIARLDAAGRDDIYTADTLAWTLFRSGRVTEASVVARRAMRLGTKDPVLLFHAGLIAAAAGHRENASTWLREALRRPASLGPLRTAEARAVYLEARLGSV
jgi:tetratricopeptide (TPR) repeat protein